MARTLVTREELSSWFTNRIQGAEDCAGTTVTVKYLLQQPDADGCNWSEDVTLRLGPQASEKAAAAAVGKLMSEARKTFNLKT